MTTAKRSLHHKIGSSRRPRRLQVEPLEPRLVMSGVPGTEALTGALASGTLAGQAAVLSAPVGGSTTYTVAAAAAFERFALIQEIKDFLVADAIARYRDLFGQEASRWPVYYREGRAVGFNSATLMSAPMTASGADLTANYSGTNTQVAGVDEADLMETDGNYLYMLSRGELVIVDVRSIQKPVIAAREKLDQGISSMYLSGDRLTLISKPIWNRCGDGGWGYGSTGFEVTVLDVANRTSPKIVQRTSFEGTLLDSRAIGNRVCLVISHDQYLPSPIVVPKDGPSVTGDPYYWDADCRYETQIEYQARLMNYVKDYRLPRFTSFGADGAEIASGPISDPTRIYKPDTSEHWSQLTTVVAMIDMASNRAGPTDAISLPGGNVSQIYVSGGNLYLLGAVGNDWSDGSERTSVRKIALGDDSGRLELVSQGSVAGHILDQFSVDEYGGLLRIATTEGWWGGENHVFVLGQDGTALKTIGSLDGLARGEKIYSVRFLGDQAFVVTYQKVDPLFGIDLGDPTAPKVKGELTIPGFSNYLQAIGGGYLVGVGRDADGGLYQDPQVSLFDVNDLADPKLAGRFTIPTGRTGGVDIFTDHHLVAYYPDSHLLTVSVPDATDSNYWHGANDLYVFRVDTSDASAGLTMLGKIEHDDSVLRSVEIGEHLISISASSISVHDLNDPQSVVATLTINTPGDPEEDPGLGWRVIVSPIVSPIVVTPLPAIRQLPMPTDPVAEPDPPPAPVVLAPVDSPPIPAVVGVTNGSAVAKRPQSAVSPQPASEARSANLAMAALCDLVYASHGRPGADSLFAPPAHPADSLESSIDSVGRRADANRWQ